MSIKKICLLGYMGSGKSSVGKELSLQLNMDFVDLDVYIEQSEKKSIRQIFIEDGEQRFRKLETYYLESLVLSNKDLIIALGGGTPCNDINLKIISPYFSVYLKTSVSILCQRIYPARYNRPLIMDLNEVELETYIHKTLQIRQHFYEKAKLIINNDGTMMSAVDKIIQNFNSNSLPPLCE